MKANKYLVRYYPPGIIVELVSEEGETETRSIDLLDLNEDSDPERIALSILLAEPSIPQSKSSRVVKMVQSKPTIILRVEGETNIQQVSIFQFIEKIACP